MEKCSGRKYLTSRLRTGVCDTWPPLSAFAAVAEKIRNISGLSCVLHHCIYDDSLDICTVTHTYLVLSAYKQFHSGRKDSRFYS